MSQVWGLMFSVSVDGSIKEILLFSSRKLNALHFFFFLSLLGLSWVPLSF